MRKPFLSIAALALLNTGCSEYSRNETEALDRLKSSLFDPESAQFRNVHEIDREGGYIVCGEVNAKNRLGGYTGFKKFSATEKENDFVIAGDDFEGMLAATLIENLCEFPDG